MDRAWERLSEAVRECQRLLRDAGSKLEIVVHSSWASNATERNVQLDIESMSMIAAGREDEVWARRNGSTVEHYRRVCDYLQSGFDDGGSKPYGALFGEYVDEPKCTGTNRAGKPCGNPPWWREGRSATDGPPAPFEFGADDRCVHHSGRRPAVFKIGGAR
jgi:hypothetical protein